MGFVSLQFVIFICMVFAAYWLTAPRYRYVVLFVSGCVFYYDPDEPVRLWILLLVSLWTFLGGLCIERYRKPCVYWLFFLLNLAALAFCKAGDLMQGSIVLPVGMSFYVFQTCWYLSDVYRKRLRAEHNVIRYGAFSMFFPAVLSGPIQKGRERLPAIRRGGTFDADLARHGLELFLWGMFVKLFVSNRLSPAVAYIYDRPGFYSKAYYLPAAMLFALQLYADFAAYSDMAIGVSAMLGYPMQRNFNNPFLSTSLSELWNRWHVSLNEWFLENLYFPLGGSRKGQVRKYANELAVFLVSGLWHGQGVHFLFWGAYNGILMIVGQVVAAFRAGYTSRHQCDHDDSQDTSTTHVRRTKPLMIVIWIRRLVVFLLFSLTFIFFRANTMEAGLVMTAGIFTIRPSDYRGFYPQQMFAGSTMTMLISLALVLVFLVVQYLRREEDGAGARNLSRWKHLPTVLRVTLLAAVLAACVIAACGSSATINSQFVYYNF